MWKDFRSKGGHVCYELFRQIFSKEKITFGEPPQDECDICVGYEEHQKENIEEHNGDSCTVCLNAKQHLERARVSRNEYQKPAAFDEHVFAVDMQKIILLTKMTIKEHFFVSRLVVFNETFASMSVSESDYVVLWHEGVNGRSASGVASAFIKCLITCGSKKVVFWADNCGAQNKNWTLFTALSVAVNTEWGPEQVTIKFLEKGHTFMKADSVQIGKKMRKNSVIYTFDDFVEICSTAGKNIKPVLMNTSDFYQFECHQRVRKTKGVSLPLLATLCEVSFKKGSRSMYYKNSFNGEAVEVDFLRPTFNEKEMPHAMTQPRGVPSSKKGAILKLMAVAPNAKKKFWLDLVTNEEMNDLVDVAD